MRKALISVGSILLVSLVLGSTVFRTQVADAASAVLNVFVTNDSSHPVPVREQNTDANGNIKVHEQGTANVSVTNPSLTVAPPTPVTGGGALVTGSVGINNDVGTRIATALEINMTSGVRECRLQFGASIVADVNGPAFGGDSTVVLALTRPIEFNNIVVLGGSGDTCTVSIVGAQP